MCCSSELLSIAVIGGGNIGTQFACQCASKGYKVNVLSSKQELFTGELMMVDDYGRVTRANIHLATNNVDEAVKGCNVIFITYPAFKLAEIAEKLVDYSHEGVYICVVPGTGGAEFAFKNCVFAGATLIGLQRVPSVSRLEEYGRRVRCEGMRNELFIASIPGKGLGKFAAFMSEIWGIKCSIMPNYLNVTLTPSNPILHTTRLKTIFDDYTNGKIYERNPLFYGDWNDKSSELTISCDEELQTIRKRLPQMDLSYVKSLKLHYESDNVRAMTKKISSIPSLHNIRTPMKQVAGGWIPDFDSRYFTADFPYGLAIIEAFADVLKVDVPNIKDTLMWYRNVTRRDCIFDLGKFGICNEADIYKFYQTKGNNI